MNQIMNKTTMKWVMAGTAIKLSMMAAVFAMAAPSARADDKDDGSTSVQLSAEARRMVQQDRVLGTLNVEKTAKTPEEVQAFINGKMQGAKKQYDAVSGLKVTTGNYNVYKDYQNVPEPKKGEVVDREKYAMWRGSQELRLDGAKKDDLLDLIASLQKQGFAITSLDFYMSRDAEDAVKDDLIAEALKNIQQRAKNIQQTLGMKTIRYARIDLNTGGRPVPMMARGMAMAKAEAFDAAAPMAAPVGEAGETEVVVNVSAEVKLK